MACMKLSDYVVAEIAKRTRSRHVFMISGGMAVHLIESFGTHPDMTVIPCHHEQAAGIAASSYSRVTGTPGVLMVTAGPGALNAVTPCGGAWMESVPLVIVSGQVARANSRQGHPVRQRGIQEVEIVDVVASITKYAVKIVDPESVRYHVERGLALMVSGRPGPVWFDIPVDVQAATIQPEALRGYTPEESSPRRSPPNVGLADRTELHPIVASLAGDAASVVAVRNALAKASRPLLVLGHGVRISGAVEDALQLIDRTGIPFQTSWNAMDIIGDEHESFVGRANAFAARWANLVIQNADFVLAVGCRFGIQHTGYDVEGFCRGARLAMVDIDRHEMEKPGLEVDHKIVMDARAFLQALNALEPTVDVPSVAEWRAYCKKVKHDFPPFPGPEENTSEDFVEPRRFIERLSERMPADAVFPFGSSGMAHTLTGALFACKKGQRVFTFKGLASMGYGLPCAVGAAVAAPGRPVFTLIGEGGLQLNIQELQTAREFKLPIKVMVFNNGGYHSIHTTQNGFFHGHFVASGPESHVSFPRLPDVAAVYGMDYFSVRNDAAVDTVLDAFMSSPKAAFLEVFVDPTRALQPRIATFATPAGPMVSRPLDDMVPLLDRDTLREYMFIPILD